MVRVLGGLRDSTRLFVACVVVGYLVLCGAQSTAAAAQAVDSSVTISAVIAPVRSIVVNQQGVIQQITSNSPAAVTPTVYRNSLQGPAVALNSSILKQYHAILPHLNRQRTGIIYRRIAIDHRPTQQSGLLAWLRNYEHLSVLPML
jgi:hypothetical protein